MVVHWTDVVVYGKLIKSGDTIRHFIYVLLDNKIREMEVVGKKDGLVIRDVENNRTYVLKDSGEVVPFDH